MTGSRRCIIVAFVILASSAFVLTVSQEKPDVAISGSLTREDVERIQTVLSRERAPLFRGKFAAKGGTEIWRRLRERFVGKLRSITEADYDDVLAGFGGRWNAANTYKYVQAEFGDRWNAGITYEYELRRESNGWIVVGIGYRWESDRIRSAASKHLKGETAPSNAVKPRP
jgi:hypothetical protein